MNKTAICVGCRTKASMNSEIIFSRQLLNLLQSKTRQATEEQKQKALLKLRQTPSLHQMCYNNTKCKYGISCPELKSSMLNNINENIAKEIVLLGCIDHKQLVQYVHRLRGKYPNAVNYIYRLQR